MINNLPIRNILVIDMKSFFASCECVDRNLDPFKTPLVVADPTRKGSMTLAVTPYLRNKGLASRTRLYDIPKNLKYMIVPPRHKLYIEMSKKIVKIFEEFVSKEDILVYSIDESFLDVTNYLKLYNMTDYELAKKIMQTIKDKTGLVSTSGIGPNMLIAKVAMDIEAKHTKDNIAKWSYEDIPNKFWNITPLSKFWGIGKRLEKRLNEIGINTIGDLANYDKKKLILKFGSYGEELWKKANGIDLSNISDYNVPTLDKSYGHSQVLFKDYYGDNIGPVVKEMVEILVKRLRQNNKLTSTIGFGVDYSMMYGGGFYHSRKISNPTNDFNTLFNECMNIFDKFYLDFPIRKVIISFASLTDNTSMQLNIFENYTDNVKRENTLDAVDKINLKYGKDSIIKASSLLK